MAHPLEKFRLRPIGGFRLLAAIRSSDLYFSSFSRSCFSYFQIGSEDTGLKYTNYQRI